MNNCKAIQQMLNQLCVNETIDGLYFWGPKLLLSTDTSQYDEVFLCIEGTFTITENDRVTTMKRNDKDKLQHLCKLSFQKISSVMLTSPNNLCLRFETGIQLQVFGENEQFEGWQFEARVDEEKIIIVAGPYDTLTLFE